MEEEGGEGVKVRNRVQSCRTHVAEVLKDTGEVFPSLFTRKLLSFETLCVGSANFFLSIEQKQQSIVSSLPRKTSATSVRLIIDQFVSLSLFIFFIFFSPLFSPLFLPPLPLFFLFRTIQRTAFVRRERGREREREGGRGRKKRQGEQREKERRVFALSNELLRYFRLAESAGLKWNLG